MWRHLPGLRRCAYTLNGSVGRTVNHTVRGAIIPIILNNTVIRRSCSRENRSMTRAGIRWHVVVVQIVTHKSLAHQSLEANRREIIPIALKVVIPHLIHSYSNNQPWWFSNHTRSVDCGLL